MHIRVGGCHGRLGRQVVAGEGREGKLRIPERVGRIICLASCLPKLAGWQPSLPCCPHGSALPRSQGRTRCSTTARDALLNRACLPSLPLQNGWRFVFDVSGGRRFRIWRGKELLLDTRARLVGMDSLAAGWQRQSNAEHERSEDGISLVLDLAQSQPGQQYGSGNLAKTPVARFFNQPLEPAFQRPGGWKTDRFPAAALARAKASAPVLRAAAAAAVAEADGKGADGEGAEEGPNIPLHCFHCAALSPGPASGWLQVEASDGEAPLQRWCAACDQARRRGGLWGSAGGNNEGSSSDGEEGSDSDGGEEHVRPAVAAGACCPDGCSACTLQELTWGAQRTRNQKRKKRKAHDWGRGKKNKGQKNNKKKGEKK